MNLEEFQLGDYTIKPKLGVICLDDECQSIEPKAMAVLCELRNNAGQVVSQQQLFETVWPDRVFSPSSLQRIIAMLRKSLNDSSQSPRFLFTHPKMGYRLEGVELTTNNVSAPKEKGIKQSTWVVVFLVLCLLTLSVISWLEINVPNSPSRKVLTFTDAKEHNAQFSSSGKFISYMTESDSSNGLVILDAQNTSEIAIHQLSQPLLNYHWLSDDSLIAMRHQNAGSLEIVRIKNLLGETLQFETVAELSGSYSLKSMTLEDSKLYFAASESKSAHADTYIYTYDVLSNTLSQGLSIGQNLTHVALAANKHVLFVHTSNHSKHRLGKANASGDIIWLNEPFPAYAAIAWSNQLQSLIVSDTLTPKQYLLKDEKLTPLGIDSPEILRDISIHNNLMLAATQKNDMDIIQWHDDTIKPVIKTKFPDYLFKKSMGNVYAYNSNRNGYPQLFIQVDGVETLVYENTHATSFIPPVSWHRNRNEFIFSASGHVYFYRADAKLLATVKDLSSIQRVISWPAESSAFFFTEDGKTIEHDFETGSSRSIEIEKPVFLSRDEKNAIFGASNTEIFWGNKSKPLGPKQPIFAFSLNGHLILNWQNKTGNHASIYNNKLESIRVIALPTECDVLTDGELDSEGKYQWYCTRYSSDDLDVVRYELNE